jgi:hypothetical protein
LRTFRHLVQNRPQQKLPSGSHYSGNSESGEGAGVREEVCTSFKRGAKR